MALPDHEQAEAAAAWAAMPVHGAPDALLSDLRRAAARGAAGLEDRERALVREWGAAHVDVIRGGDVSQVAQARAISGPLSIEMLDLVAVRVIAENLSEHDHLPTLLQRAGVTSELAIEQLEDTAARRVGSAAVQRGRPVADIVQHMGFATPGAIRSLCVEGAEHDVAMGARVPDVVRAYGVGDIRDDLESHAAQTRGLQLALRGVPLPAIVAQTGIETRHGIAGLARLVRQAVADRSSRTLQETVLTSPGGQAHRDMAASGNVHDVAQRHGITAQAGVSILEYLAAQRLQNTVRASDHLPTLLAQSGVTSPPWIHHLEQTLAHGAGTTAVQRGEEPQAVASRLGIHSPAALHRLNLAAAEGDIALGLNAQAVMRARQITDANEQLGLELWAVASAGQRALDAGESIDEIAQRHGVTHPEALQALQRLAARHPLDWAP